MNKGFSASSQYLPRIDGLRAIAVLSVLIYHWKNTVIPGGFTGVDIFFVISGYVISKSLAASTLTSFPEYILLFYKRRFLRIIPALLFCLIVTSVLSIIFVPQAWLSAANGATAKWAVFGVSNIYLVSVADGYFSQRIHFNPFVHTWSLAVEEQFYLIFPLVFYFWLKRRNDGASLRALRILALPILTLLSIALASHETPVAHDRAFYLLPSRFWELAAGAMLFQFQDYRARQGKQSANSEWLLTLGAVLLTVGFIYIDEVSFPFPWALVPVAGTLLMIAGAGNPTSTSAGLPAVLAMRPITYIGRISYSLYLWHWPVFVLFRWTVGLTGPIQSLSAITLTFTLAAFSYHFIENTFRQNDFLKRQAGGIVVAIGLCSVVIAGYVVTGLFDRYSRFSLSVTKDKYVWDAYFYPGRYSTGPAINNIGAGRRILLVGDSHAGAYHTMASLAAANLGAETKIFTRPGCSIARLVVATRDAPHCQDFEESILGWIKENSRPEDILFVASLRLDRLGDQWVLFDQQEVISLASSPARFKEREIALAEAAEFVKECKALGLHVLMDAPPPVFKAPPFRCSDWFNRSNPICAPGFTIERDFYIKYRAATMQSLAVLHESLGVIVWDPLPVLCDGSMCSAFKDGKPIFADGDHLTGFGNRLLVPSFTSQLQDIWEGQRGPSTSVNEVRAASTSVPPGKL